MTSSFPPLNFGKDPATGADSTITSSKAEGRAWAYDSGRNVWALVDISVLRFYGTDPIVSDVKNAEVTYSVDLNRISPVPVK